MRFVIDTNLLVSAVIKPANIPGVALAIAQKRGKLCFSKETREELFRVLIRTKFDQYVSQNERIVRMEAILGQADFISTEKYAINECRDPDDNKFRELAAAADVSYIITGDQDLLILNPFRSIPIVSAVDFIRIFS